MSGMHRLLAAILLAGAVGGVAVFARHLGRVPEPLAARLSAPPPQHLTAPGAVHAPLLVTVRPGPFGATRTIVRGTERTATPPLTLSAAKPLAAPRVTRTPRQPVAPAAEPAATTPATTPVAAPAATPPQEQPRVLAAEPLTPVVEPTPSVLTPTSTDNGSSSAKGHGKGHANGKAKHAKPTEDTATSAAQPPATVTLVPAALAPPVSQPAPVVVLTPVVSSSDESADADQVMHGHGWGRGNGKGHRG